MHFEIEEKKKHKITATKRYLVSEKKNASNGKLNGFLSADSE